MTRHLLLLTQSPLLKICHLSSISWSCVGVCSSWKSVFFLLESDIEEVKITNETGHACAVYAGAAGAIRDHSS